MYRDLIGRETPIHVTKYDGSYHRRVPARFVLARAPAYLLTVPKGVEVTRTPDPSGDSSPHITEHVTEIWLFEDRWWDVERQVRDGRVLYYANINLSCEFDGAAFHYVDLDLDVWWWTDEAPEVLDEDEFLANSQAMRYPAAVIDGARSAVDEVLRLMKERAFPFDRA